MTDYTHNIPRVELSPVDLEVRKASSEGPRLPEDLANVNQGRVIDLVPGDWGLGGRQTVLRSQDTDDERGIFLVDTNDSVKMGKITAIDFETMPVIMRTGIEDDGSRQFVADLRRVRHFLYNQVPLVISDGIPLENNIGFDHRVRVYGTQVLRAVVLRNFPDNNDYKPVLVTSDVTPAFTEKVSRFCAAVDEIYRRSCTGPAKTPSVLFDEYYHSN